MPKRFRVALSFAGENRVLIRRVAELLSERIGPARVLFDEFHEKFVWVYSAMLGGPKELKKGKRLIDTVSKQELYTDKDNIDHEGWLIRDILLVSRILSGLPNCDLLLLSGDMVQAHKQPNCCSTQRSLVTTTFKN
jgi:hypothetical protein